MRGREEGQAAAELVALLPCLAAVLAAAWQLVLAGHAAWAVTAAARAAARASAVGTDPVRAARSHLPGRLERGLRIRRGAGGAIELSLRVPTVVPAIDLGRVHAEARFEPQSAAPRPGEPAP
jgi:hypothetical protein